MLTGAAWRGLIRGARAGWLATTVALIGFYVAVTWLSRGSLGGSGLRSDFVLEVRLNGLYFRAGTISGPVLGAVGGWIARRRLAVIPIVAGALLASEILAVAVVQGRSLPVGPGMFFLSVVA